MHVNKKLWPKHDQNCLCSSLPLWMHIGDLWSSLPKKTDTVNHEFIHIWAESMTFYCTKFSSLSTIFCLVATTNKLIGHTLHGTTMDFVIICPNTWTQNPSPSWLVWCQDVLMVFKPVCCQDEANTVIGKLYPKMKQSCGGSRFFSWCLFFNLFWFSFVHQWLWIWGVP